MSGYATYQELTSVRLDSGFRCVAISVRPFAPDTRPSFHLLLLQMIAHKGHHDRLFTLLGVAFHPCPYKQRHDKAVRAFKYSSDKHNPPLSIAMSCNWDNPSGRLRAQSGHQVP